MRRYFKRILILYTVGVRKLLISALIGVVCISIALRIQTIMNVPPVGDEPDDYNILVTDIPRIRAFFAGVRASDQSRLPFLAAAPFVALYEKGDTEYLQEESLIPMRFWFFGLFLIFVGVCYTLARTVFGRGSAGIYTVLLLTSAFLSSFSVFTMTTSDTLFLLFFALAFTLFYRGFTGEAKTAIFPGVLPACFAMALCIGSKLTGVVFLAAFFIVHCALFKSRPVNVTIPNPMKLTFITLISIAGLFFINRVDFFGPVEKLFLAGLSGASYISYFLVQLWKERKYVKTVAISFFNLWILIVSVCFLLTVIVSPIYLNFDNIVAAIGWFSRYGGGEVVADSHWYDIFVIIVTKFGFISTFMLIIPLYVYIRGKRFKKPGIFLIMSAVTIFIYILVTSIIKHTVVWYGLPVMIFLYLPFVWLYDGALKTGRNRLTTVALFCLVIVIGDNMSRYISWFPYGQFDGAQYGRQFIRWDKPGFVSFEALPYVYRHLAEAEKSTPADRRITVASNTIPLTGFNGWVTILLNEYANEVKDDPRFRYIAVRNDQMPVQEREYDYILTSPLYNPESERTLRSSRSYSLEKIIRLKNLPVLSIWGRKM